MFDKKKDFMDFNSTIPTIDAGKAYDMFVDILTNKTFETIPANANFLSNSCDVKLFITIFSKSDYCLKRYHKLVSKSDPSTRKLFFYRNKNYERLILSKNVKGEYSCDYFNCFTEEPIDLREAVFGMEDVDIIFDYIFGFITKINKKNELYIFINILNKLFSKELKTDSANYILRISQLVQRRIYELEEYLYVDGNENDLIDYAYFHKFSNERIINATIENAKEINSFYRLERHIAFMFADRSAIKNIRSLEQLFIEGLEFSTDPSFINLLMFYTKSLIKSKDFAIVPFYEGINILSKSIKRNPSVICPFLQDIYGFCFFSTTLPIEWDKIERLQSSTEEYFIQSSFVNSDIKIQYIQYFNLSNDIEIEETIVKSNDCSLIYLYSTTFKKRMPQAENIISRDYILSHSYALENKVRMPLAEPMMIGNKTSFQAYLNMLHNLHPEGIERFHKKIEKEILRNTDLTMAYVNATRKNCIAFENILLKGLVSNHDMKKNISCVELSMKRIVNYCNMLGRRIKKMENVIFGVIEKINCYLVDIYDKGLSTDVNNVESFVLDKTIKSLLVSYIIDIVKKPLVEADNSILKNEPRYIEFKENYEKQRTARGTRQRRKSNRVSPHQQSQSGQGQQTLIGEDTNV